MSELAAGSRVQAAWRVLQGVPDPEVPVLSVCELGIVREVIERDGSLEVVLTPTYNGCPATEAIRESVLEALSAAGLGPASVSMRLAPAWTTDWIDEPARQKLREYGIAPPGRAGESVVRVVPRHRADPVPCPRCGSAATEQLSAFGATACKSLYRCMACREPFEHFKPI